MVDRRSQFHQLRLAERVTPLNPAVDRWTQYFAQTRMVRGGVTRAVAEQQGTGLLSRMVYNQAREMAYLDPFLRVDLTGVNFIDAAGEACLAAMQRQGVEFVAADCLTKKSDRGRDYPTARSRLGVPEWPERKPAVTEPRCNISTSAMTHPRRTSLEWFPRSWRIWGPIPTWPGCWTRKRWISCSRPNARNAARCGARSMS
jgi:hypothetical protein